MNLLKQKKTPTSLYKQVMDHPIIININNIFGEIKMMPLFRQLILSKLLYLPIILITAFVLRIWGIDFGLPYIYHTDEWNEVKRALMLGAGVLDFERVGKGGYFYLLFCEYGIYYAILKTFSVVHSSEQFLYKLFQDPTSFWLIGRITTAVIGTLNCFLLYVLGKHAFSKTVGLFASLFMAIHLLHVASSHYITVDVPLTTLITICFIIMYRKTTESFSKWHYILLGIFAALATMTKIPGAVIIFPILLFHYNNLKSEHSKVTFKSYFCDSRLLMFSVIFTVVYILGEPGIIFQFKGLVRWGISFINPFTPVSESISSRLYDIKSPVRIYLIDQFPIRYFLTTIFICGGFIVCLKQFSYRKYLFLLFLIPYFFFLFSSKSKELVYARYLLPIMPILFVYVGIFLEYLLNVVDKRRVYWKILIFTVLMFSIYPLLKDSIAFDIDKTRPDTRTLAKEWVEKNIPSDSVIYIEGGGDKPSTMTVPLNLKPEHIDGIILDTLAESGEEMSDKKNKFYEIKKKSLQNKKTYHLILTYNKKQLVAALNQGIGDYVILRDKTKNTFNFDVNRKRFSEIHRLLSWVDSDDFKLIKEFKTTRKLTGPKILIYERTQATQARIQEGTSNNYETKENSYNS